MTERRRVTQLRASWVDGTALQAVWLVTEPRQLEELADDATRDLGGVYLERHVQASGLVAWHTQRGDGASLWLVADVAVEPYVEPRRDQTRRATTPH